MEILEIRQRMDLFDQAVKAFWEPWGNEQNYPFYEDCIRHSCLTTEELPRFYIALQEDMIIGTCALLRNDLNSRQDLCPWLGCLYVDPEHRGNRLGALLLNHAVREAARKGYPYLYLTTDLEGYYEKYGWNHVSEAIGIGGTIMKVYRKPTA